MKTAKYLLPLMMLMLALSLMLAACNDGDEPEDTAATEGQTNAPVTEAPETEPSHEHTWGEWTENKAATCTEKGSEKRSCECGESESRPMDTLGHTEATDPAVKPTCTETGLTEGLHCSVCGTILTSQETVAALGHNFENRQCVVCSAYDVSIGLAYTSLWGNTCCVSGMGTCTDTYVIIPEISPKGETVVGISDSAFSGCSNLTGIRIPDSVTDITYNAFYNCNNLTDVRLPNGITYISLGVFYNCSSLTEIEIPNTVTSIGRDAFSGCDQLIQIENGVSYVNQWAIDFEDNTAHVILRPDTIGIGDGALWGSSNMKSIEIPDSVTIIGSSAFFIARLVNVEFGENSRLQRIGAGAFHGCSLLTNIEIPDSVTSIGPNAFEQCGNLFQIEDGVYYVDKWVAGCENGVTQVILRSDTRGLVGNAFRDCDTLTSITIPDGVTSIGEGTFYGCENLTDIALPNSVTNIDMWAFTNCLSLTDIEIPYGVTSIGEMMFAGCHSLTSVIIPSSVMSIGEGVFDNQNGLMSITFTGTKTEWSAITRTPAWYSSAGGYDCTIHCTDGDIYES